MFSPRGSSVTVQRGALLDMLAEELLDLITSRSQHSKSRSDIVMHVREEPILQDPHADRRGPSKKQSESSNAHDPIIQTMENPLRFQGTSDV